jgi:hypothetical protein
MSGQWNHDDLNHQIGGVGVQAIFSRCKVTFA